jgi:hypothetical protein
MRNNAVAKALSKTLGLKKRAHFTLEPVMTASSLVTG